jgi:hypothetical protein
MTNAPGFHHNEREERMGGDGLKHARSVDINRDFPYNQDSTDDCMQTLAGRVVFRLFAENLFVSSITFHGGTNSITYPWGSNNHISKLKSSKGAECPDHVAFDVQAKAMSSAGGESFSVGTYLIHEYPTGDMTSVVYPVGGGMEDWAYGAGWDNKSPDAAITSCSPKTYKLDSDFFTKTPLDHIRTAIYLIEMDRSKDPSSLSYGSRAMLKNNATGVQFYDRNSVYDTSKEHKHNGQINKNLRTTLQMIDMAKPYISVQSVNRRKGSTLLEVEFTVEGCSEIDSVEARTPNETLSVQSDMDQVGYCKYNPNSPQTRFTTVVDASQSLYLSA